MSYGRINLFLGVLLLALLSATWLLERDPGPAQTERLTAWQPEQIRQLKIANRSGPAFELERDNGGWRMTTPYRVQANQSRIERLLPISSAAVTASFPLPTTELEQFGLDKPLAELWLNGRRLLIGATDPVNHQRYVANGERLLLIHDTFPHLLLAPAEQYVAPQLIATEGEIEWLSTPGWRLDRQPQSLQTWRLEPAPAQISNDLLIAKIADWRYAQAASVSRAGLDPDARAGIRLQISGENAPREFVLVETETRPLLVDPTSQLGYEIPNIEALLAAPGSNPPE
ncbi:MAG: DUF4340 domain-containing protein [Gammaproteobacteria bacterium]|nr:DUF4340 domain-containing protein [Gammaproteobacteria bacterium]